jgi:hypothetical protein
MHPISPEMVEAIFAEEAEPTALLVTLYSDDLLAPILACSDPDGIVSRGEQYDYFPFTFSWGGATASEPARGARLEIGNSDDRIMRAIRGLPSGAQVFANCELVRTVDPDEVEMAIMGARVSDIDVDDPKVTGQLATRTFDTEPACAQRYVAARTPGLF